MAKNTPLAPQAEARKVKAYLNALENRGRPRGRRTVEYMERRIAEVTNELESASGLDKVLLIQERLDLEKDLANASESDSLELLEEEFKKVVVSYSQRK